MNNFFLLNEALNTVAIDELEAGISNLNSILIERNANSDVLMKHHSIWEYHNGHGLIIDFYHSILSKEIQRLVPKFFESLIDYPNYISDDIQFDAYFPNDCNAHLGINFSTTTISIARQVPDRNSYIQFKNNCAVAQAHNSIQSFWDSRLALFPNLIFCEGVWGQIQHLSINDDRFKLINQKLKKLDEYTKDWVAGAFDYKNLALNCSPDTPTRVENTKALRTFMCPIIGNRVFSLHAKWYYGSEPFRLYFYPETINHKVYIGYIGGKDEIGF
jgi:hypothetical protein